MKICYVWVEQFKNFNDFGLNLASNFKFSYDKSTNVVTKTDTNFKPAYIFPSKIKDVCGIIGENGTGKSNALELLCMALKNNSKKLTTNFLIITEDNGNYTCHVSIAGKPLPECDDSINIVEYTGSINETKVIFFSNVFDEKEYTFDTSISDISVNKDHMLRFSRGENNASNIYKQLNFINSDQFDNLGITYPNQIIVQLRHKIFFNRQSTNNKDLDKMLSAFYFTLRKRIRDLNEESQFINTVRLNFFMEYLSSFYYYLFRKGENNTEIEEVLKYFESKMSAMQDIITDLKTDDVTHSLIKSILDFANRYDEKYIKLNKFNSFLSKKNELINSCEFLLDIRSRLSSVKLSRMSYGVNSREYKEYSLNYDEDSKSIIMDIIKAFDYSRSIKLKWIGISSGHKAYLNLFSSVHHSLKVVRSENIILCIDEGDLYLHPKWQAEFFDRLQNFLCEVSPCDIQLVLTSHSPFLVSDLPRHNLVILKNLDSLGLVQNQIEVDTFGANLYELYSKAFFLNNIRTGCFSKSKIDELIEISDSQPLDKIKIKTLKNVVKLIGDKVIKFRINERINGND